MADLIFWFDPSTGIFYTNDGEKVPLRIVAGLSSDSIDESISAVYDMATLLDSGGLTANAWRELMQEEIKQEYIRQYLLGHGGRLADMTFTDWGRIGAMVKEQYKYLLGFADEIASGNLSLEQIQARAGMYCNSAREAFEKSRGRVMADADMDEEKWLLGPVQTEHCFPAGTMINTPNGQFPIESIQLGNMVNTLYGPKRVTRLYKRDYFGPMTTINADRQKVTCTSNHPFLTQRGWIRADKLLPEDRLMFYENGSNPLNREFAFPDTNDGVPTSRHVGFLGEVALALFNLPFKKWLKARMAMPPITVGLNNKCSNFEIYNKFGFDKKISFVDNTKGIKYVSSALFKFARFISLYASMSFHEFYQYIRATRRLFTQSFVCSRLMRWIVNTHMFCGLGTNNVFCRIWRQFQTNTICFISDLNQSQSNMFRYLFGPHIGIMSFQVVENFAIPNLIDSWVSPQKTLRNNHSRRHMRFAEINLPNPIMPTNRTMLSGFSDTKVSIVDVPTIDRAKAALQRLSFWSHNHELFSTSNTILSNGKHILPPYNDNYKLKLYTTFPNKTRPVYNLEVEDVHHYIANGFVVHNCDDCLGYATQDWEAIGTFPFPGDGSTQCLTNCACTKIYRNSQTGYEEEAE